MNDTIKTLKNLLLNSDNTSKDFYIDIDKIDKNIVFDALINKTEFYDKYGKTYFITESGLNDDGIQLHVKFDNGPTDNKMQHSICEIAEQIFAAKVDLDLNKEDTKQLWEKCIDKAIIIYFNYQTVIDKVDEFFTKPQPIYDNLPEEEKEKIKKIWIKH